MSHKVRVHELAKKYEKNSKDIIDALFNIGIELQSHLSGIEPKDIDRATTYLDQKFLLNKRVNTDVKKSYIQAGTLRKKVQETLENKSLVTELGDRESRGDLNSLNIDSEKKDFLDQKFNRSFKRKDEENRTYDREGSYKSRLENRDRSDSRFENKSREFGNNRFENRDRSDSRFENKPREFGNNRFENRDRSDSRFENKPREFGNNRFENRDRSDSRFENKPREFGNNRFENRDRSDSRFENKPREFGNNRFENRDRSDSRFENKPREFGNNRFENRDRSDSRFENKPREFGNNRFENRDRSDSRFENRPRDFGNNRFENRSRDFGSNRFESSEGRSNNLIRPTNNYGNSFPRREGYRPLGENKFQDKDKDSSHTFDSKRTRFVKKDEKAPFPLETNKLDRKKYSDKKKVNKYQDSSEKPFSKRKSTSDELASHLSNRKAYKRKKKELVQKKGEAAKNLLKEERIIILGDDITVKLLAERIGINATEIIKYLFLKGQIFTPNSLVPFSLIEEIALQYNVLVGKEEKREKYIQKIEQIENNDLIERAPIVTIIGHVDHGKTSLLDAIRKSSITLDEAGGITQRIGAYQVEKNGKKITFIDTPGHEAFSDMRARGTSITDIAILVVAADDGVMPQTIEAISHAEHAKVPIVVAINKVDKPNSNIERVKQQLADHNLLAREWGGDTEIVEISAIRNINLDKLLDVIIISSEIMELKANPNRLAKAIVLESRLDPKVGAIANIIVKDGTLKRGDIFIVSNSIGKVRSITDEHGRKLDEATPSSPVEIFGLDKVPETGDLLEVMENEKIARKFLSEKEIKDEQSIIYTNIHESEGLKDYKIIIKTGSKGSLEAVKSSILKIQNDEVKISLIYSATGSVNESDIKLAHASKAKIITFEVPVSPKARKDSEDKKIEIKSYNIIYKLIEELENEIKNIAPPKFKDSYQGRIEIKRIFKVSKVGTIGGSIVIDGKMSRDSKIKLFRNSKEIFEGKILSLKRFNNDASSVEVGQECGIALENYNDIKEGDIIEAYITEQV